MQELSVLMGSWFRPGFSSKLQIFFSPCCASDESVNNRVNGGAVGSTVGSQLEGPIFDSQLGSFLWGICTVCLAPNDMHVKWIGAAKLPLWGKMCVSALWWTGSLSRVFLLLLLYECLHRLVKQFRPWMELLTRKTSKIWQRQKETGPFWLVQNRSFRFGPAGSL